MYAKDFYYDGVTLSSLGYVLCSFDGGSDRGVGSEISFVTIPTQRGAKQWLADYKYENCLSTTLYICKDPCHIGSQEDLILSPEDVSSMMRWLNRKEFKPFIFNNPDYSDITFNATFNVSAVYIGDEIFGLELQMTTDAPFATKPRVSYILEFTSPNQTLQLKDVSDEVGYVYPRMIVTCGASGELRIHNALEDRTTIVKNCSEGEIIAFELPEISQLSLPPAEPFDHDLANDFNYVFPRIANTYYDRFNPITCSMPATIQISYEPIIKIVL